MRMKQCSFDTEHGTLRISTGQPSTTFQDLAEDIYTLVELNEDNPSVIGIAIQHAEPYVALEKGYNADTDTLTIGRTTDDPALISENGDFVGYWQPDTADYMDGALEPIGVTLRNVSEHFGKMRVYT